METNWPLNDRNSVVNPVHQSLAMKRKRNKKEKGKGKKKKRKIVDQL